MRKALIVLGASTLLGAGLGVAPASAATTATVSAVFNAAWYTAGEGQANQVVVTEFTENWDKRYVFDDVVPITPGEGCYHPHEDDPTVAICHIQSVGDIPSVDLKLGNGDDEATIRTSGLASVAGEDGADTVFGTGLWHAFRGGPGADTLIGAYELYGGPGNDTIRARQDGGGDGGEGNDTLIGHSGRELLNGGPGNDVMMGQDGDDLIHGDAGADEITGGTGADEIHGGDDPDIIFGNSGDDRLYGGAGKDEISGGPGTDLINQG